MEGICNPERRASVSATWGGLYLVTTAHMKFTLKACLYELNHVFLQKRKESLLYI